MLKVNQFINVIFFGKTINQLVFVLIHSPVQIICYAHINNFVIPIRGDVDVKVVLAHKKS